MGIKEQMEAAKIDALISAVDALDGGHQQIAAKVASLEESIGELKTHVKSLAKHLLDAKEKETVVPKRAVKVDHLGQGGPNVSLGIHSQPVDPVDNLMKTLQVSKPVEKAERVKTTAVGHYGELTPAPYERGWYNPQDGHEVGKGEHGVDGHSMGLPSRQARALSRILPTQYITYLNRAIIARGGWGAMFLNTQKSIGRPGCGQIWKHLLLYVRDMQDGDMTKPVDLALFSEWYNEFSAKKKEEPYSIGTVTAMIGALRDAGVISTADIKYVSIEDGGPAATGTLLLSPTTPAW